VNTLDNGCFHCSEALPSDNPHRFAASIANDIHYFCCPACIAVADTIQNLGLGQYYRQRDNKPQGPADNNSTTLQFSDVDLLTLPTDSEGFCETQLFIPDIHCASCCWLIEQRLQQLAGVTKANAQLNSHKLSIRWDTSRLPLSKIFHALHEIGYRASPWQPTQQQTHNNQQQKKLLQRLGVAGLLGMQIHMIAMGSYFGAMPNMQQWMNSVALLLSVPIWFYSADPFFSSAWRSLKNIGNALFKKNALAWRETFAGSMDLPVALAIVAAALNSILAVIKGTDDVYFDSIAMFVFLLLGSRLLEAQARNRLAMYAQDPVLPQVCTRMQAGVPHRVAIHTLKTNDQILLQSGIIPVDGIVLNGTASVEQAVITGEFLPVQKQRGDHVIAGTALVSGELTVLAQQWGTDSHIADLHRRMEHALSNKQQQPSSFRHTCDAIAQFFTPAVLLVACSSAAFWFFHAPAKAMPAFLAVLVASCPCALTLAIPAALTAATLQLRRQGILITGSHVLQTLPRIFHYVFDKTGTLTQGRMHIIQTRICSNLSENECLTLAYALEQHSTHPIASAFTRAIHMPTAYNFSNADVKQVLHCGIEAIQNNNSYRIGKAEWVCGHTDDDEQHDKSIALGCNGTALATFTLGDSLRTETTHCIKQLQHENVQCSIVSGDHSRAVDSIATQLGITTVYKNCSPTEKVDVIARMKQQLGALVMIGDGVNDGPVLAHADISIALADASQTARLAADVILLNNRLDDLLTLRTMAQRTQTISNQNLAWALLYNLSFLPLAAAGWLSPVSAAFGMAVSSLLVTGNALRLFTRNKLALPGHT
jgi:Cu2+-exporting ATPase